MSNNYYNQPTNVLKYFLLWLCMTNIVLAQKQKGFVYLSTENGLSQSDGNTIFQDKQGYMWFGTHDGLNRYNGYDFTVFKPTINDKNSISSNLIWKIIGDQIGNLWIGTTGEGLNYYNKTNETTNVDAQNRIDLKPGRAWQVVHRGVGEWLHRRRLLFATALSQPTHLSNHIKHSTQPMAQTDSQTCHKIRPFLSTR